MPLTPARESARGGEIGSNKSPRPAKRSREPQVERLLAPFDFGTVSAAFGRFRRVGLGGFPPRPPADPDVRVEDASGSSRCGFAVPPTIRPPRGDTLGGSMPSAWFRLPVHNAAPPSLHGVLRSSSPASSLLWDAPTPCRPSRRTSLPSFGDTTLVPDLLPPTGARGRGHGEIGIPVPEPEMSVETAGSLRFPSDPRVPAPVLGPR